MLLALLTGVTIAAVWLTSALTVLPLALPIPGGFHPIGLLTNGAVAAPIGPAGLILFGALVAFFNKDALQFMWRRSPQQVLAWTLGPFVLLFIIDEWILPKHAFGLAMDALLLTWFGTTVERRWGTQRLLWFAAVVSIGANVVAALLLWLAPSTLSALAAPTAAVPIGAGPLTWGLLAVWCLMQGDRVLPIINAPASKLLIAIAIFKGLGVIFVGVAAALYELSGIGIAVLLVTGRWHPSRWRRKPRLRPVRDESERYHRGAETLGPDLCSRDLACDTVVRRAFEGSMKRSGRGS